MRYCTAGGGQLHVIFLDRKMKMNREAYNIIRFIVLWYGDIELFF